MSTQAIRLKAEELRSAGFADLTPSFFPVGGKFENSIRIFHLQNLTDAEIFWSFDGLTDHGALPAGGFILLDITSNKTLSQGQFISSGSRVHVRSEGSPTSGNVYLSVFYGARD